LQGAKKFLVINIVLAIVLLFEGSKIAVGIAVFLLVEGLVFYFWSKKKGFISRAENSEHSRRTDILSYGEKF